MTNEYTKKKYITLKDGDSATFLLKDGMQLEGTRKLTIWDVGNKRFVTVKEPVKNSKERFTRTVISGGEVSELELNKQTNDLFMEQVDLLKQAGRDVLITTFIVKRKGSGLETKYIIGIDETVTATATPKASVEDFLKTKITTTTTPTKFTLTTQETKIIKETLLGKEFPEEVDVKEIVKDYLTAIYAIEPKRAQEVAENVVKEGKIVL